MSADPRQAAGWIILPPGEKGKFPGAIVYKLEEIQRSTAD
jgi:hypothetical protein